jgi:hypothetical protein
MQALHRRVLTGAPAVSQVFEEWWGWQRRLLCLQKPGREALSRAGRDVRCEVCRAGPDKGARRREASTAGRAILSTEVDSTLARWCAGRAQRLARHARRSCASVSPGNACVDASTANRVASPTPWPPREFSGRARAAAVAGAVLVSPRPSSPPSRRPEAAPSPRPPQFTGMRRTERSGRESC